MKKKQTELTEFGKLVKKRLIDKNMTQVELAEMLGTNKQYLSKILYGEKGGQKYIKAIMEILGD